MSVFVDLPLDFIARGLQEDPGGGFTLPAAKDAPDTDERRSSGR